MPYTIKQSDPTRNALLASGKCVECGKAFSSSEYMKYVWNGRKQVIFLSVCRCGYATEQDWRVNRDKAEMTYIRQRYRR